MSYPKRAFSLLVPALALLVSTDAIAKPPLALGERRVLMVDRHLIAELRGSAELRLKHPIPREVVFRTDRPWEGNTSAYHTIFKDGELYRMYYRGSHSGKPSHPEYVCYAESQDGIHWNRPQLGLVEHNGSKQNNILWQGVGAHDFAPFKDPNPKANPDARYKAVGRSGGEYDRKGLYAFHSSDGIHWELAQEEPIITKGAFDSQNIVFWDPIRKEYRAYFRDFRAGKRDIRTATSENFLRWSDPVWLEYGDAPAEHLYTNQIRPYYRAPHLFIGFPTRYLPKRGSIVEGLFMTSRDGRRFHRWEEAFIRPGLNPDKWQNRSNYIWDGLVETAANRPGAPPELSLYTNEAYYEGEAVRIRRYTLRIDGFVAVHAGMNGGQMQTRPFAFKGKQLMINASTSAAGSIRVELQRADGDPVEGYRLGESEVHYGDHVAWRMEWETGSDVSSLAGSPVRLRFALKDADLYSLWFQ